MFDRILLPLDGSKLAEAALGVAMRIPAREVLLLYVEPEGAQTFTDRSPVARAFEARAYLEPLAEMLRHEGRRVDVDVAFGEPAELIVELARTTDLIVMATDARGIGGRAVGGCACDRVARHAPAPTLLVRAGRHPIADDLPFTRIVVPLDGSPEAEAALRPAYHLAALLGTSLHFLRVVEPVGALPADRQPAEAYLADRVRHAETGAHLTWDTYEGEPGAEIATAVQPGDLLVMTTHGAGGMRRWYMGSVAERLIRQAPVPVLVAREVIPEPVSTAAFDATAAWW